MVEEGRQTKQSGPRRDGQALPGDARSTALDFSPPVFKQQQKSAGVVFQTLSPRDVVRLGGGACGLSRARIVDTQPGFVLPGGADTNIRRRGGGVSRDPGTETLTREGSSPLVQVAKTEPHWQTLSRVGRRCPASFDIAPGCFPNWPNVGRTSPPKLPSVGRNLL